MDILKQCQKLNEKGESQQKIIDALEAIPAEERTPEMDSELARAYNNWGAIRSDREALKKAIALLEPHEEYPNDALLAECFDAEGYANQKMKNLGLSAAEHGYVSWNGSEILYEYSQPPSSPTMSM